MFRLDPANADQGRALERLSNDNEAGEYYLGDVLPLLRADGLRVTALAAADPAANLGVNHRADLSVAAAEARRRICERHMLAGVTITDPAATWIDADVEIAADATIAVTDASGAVLPGASVTITSPALLAAQTAVTSDTGAYRFANLPIIAKADAIGI